MKLDFKLININLNQNKMKINYKILVNKFMIYNLRILKLMKQINN